ATTSEPSTTFVLQAPVPVRLVNKSSGVNVGNWINQIIDNCSTNFDQAVGNLLIQCEHVRFEHISIQLDTGVSIPKQSKTIFSNEIQ
ncbi:unnamed protein product, partial [Rotaria magnacalcarata]